MEGHNPNATMLPAASSAPIVAMQGGGYDSSVSLLPQASSGSITPMQGGGHDSMATLLPPVNGADSPIVPMKGGAGNSDHEGPPEGPPEGTPEGSPETIAAESFIDAAVKAATDLFTEASRPEEAAASAAADAAAKAAEAAAAEKAAAAPVKLNVAAPDIQIEDVLGYMNQLKDSMIGAVEPFTVTITANSDPQPSTLTNKTNKDLHTTTQGLFASKNIENVAIDNPYTFDKRRVADPNPNAVPPGTLAIATIPSDTKYTLVVTGDSVEVTYVMGTLGEKPPVAPGGPKAASAAPAAASAAGGPKAATPEDSASLLVEEAVNVATTILKEATGSEATGSGAPESGATSPIQQKHYNPEQFEHQAPGLGCGRHALNNLFHAEYFIKEGEYAITDDTIAKVPPLPIPLNTLCKYLKPKYPDILDVCQESENYDINILVAGLDWIGHRTNTDKWVRSTFTLNPPDVPTTLLGYIINYGASHWVALRKLPTADTAGNQYEYTNSTAYTIDSGRKIPTRRLYKTVDEYVAEYGSQIYNVIEVSTYTGYINPLTRLTSINNNPKQKDDMIRANQIEVVKSAIATLYYAQYQDERLTNAIGSGVPKSGKSKPNGSKYTYPTDTSISEYVYHNLLMNLGDAAEGRKLIDILDNNASRVVPILANNIPDILKLTRAAIYLIIFIKSRLDPPLDLDAEEKKAAAVVTTGGGNRRRKTLRLQARQKPGRRALSHKQVHHKENENA